jgi:hypothetical protein
VVEFAVIVSALATFAASLGSLQARALGRVFASDAGAAQQVVIRARARGVPSASAREAYARAPYKRPALRYVYATAWVAGTKQPAACAFAQLDADGTRTDVLKAIRANPAALRQLRRLHVTALQAATAFARGFVSAC